MATDIRGPLRPFTVEIPPEQTQELHRRLDSARWPPADTIADDHDVPLRDQVFSMGKGPVLRVMKDLAQGWRNFSWQKAQVKINKFDHFKVGIEDLDIHFIHQRSSRPDAKAIILVHGWPGSFLEFLDVIPLLTEPRESGSQAFHVVVPSMPGYAFSDAPKTSAWRMDDTARLFDKLMVGLGYESYIAQGGDWGSICARILGSVHKDHCKAVHLNFCPVGPPAPFNWVNPHVLLDWLPKFIINETQRERGRRTLVYLERGSAYNNMQTNTPRTPAYGLNDSPIGLLAWIGEKMLPSIALAASQPDPTLTNDSLFETLSLYWYTNSIGTSFTPYALNRPFQEFLTDPQYFLPNLGLSSFPNEIAIPREQDAKRTGVLKWHKEADDGGHFAAMEKPQVFVDHVRDAVKVLLP
ncbi:hypothetical protein JCM10212_003257 [Sporobolomyces blumeae]